jgi:hypothetical protein
MSDTVEYRNVVGFPGYRVGSDGSVWSCRKRVGVPSGGTQSILTDQWRRLKPIAFQGYARVTLYPGMKSRQIHRLVLEAFVGPCPEGMECCHRDDDPFNNALSNLRWDTHRANIAQRDGRNRQARGERSGVAKLTEDLVRRIRSDHAAGIRGLARKYGINPSTIRNVVHRYAWKHVA